MVAGFGYHYLRQQARSGQSFFDDGRGQRGSVNGVASGAGVLRSHLFQYFEVRRQVLQLLAELVADMTQRCAAVGAGRGALRIQHGCFTRQVRRQLAAHRF